MSTECQFLHQSSCLKLQLNLAQHVALLCPTISIDLYPLASGSMSSIARPISTSHIIGKSMHYSSTSFTSYEIDSFSAISTSLPITRCTANSISSFQHSYHSILSLMQTRTTFSVKKNRRFKAKIRYFTKQCKKMLRNHIL